MTKQTNNKRKDNKKIDQPKKVNKKGKKQAKTLTNEHIQPTFCPKEMHRQITSTSRIRSQLTLQGYIRVKPHGNS